MTNELYLTTGLFLGAIVGWKLHEWSLKKHIKSDTVREIRIRKEIVFENKDEAQRILDQLRDIINQYGIATVSDLYDLSGMRIPYASGNYGWTQLRTAKVIRVKNGYVIKTPIATSML